jgi:hypothetical protein
LFIFLPYLFGIIETLIIISTIVPKQKTATQAYLPDDYQEQREAWVGRL